MLNNLFVKEFLSAVLKKYEYYFNFLRVTKIWETAQHIFFVIFRIFLPEFNCEELLSADECG